MRELTRKQTQAATKRKLLDAGSRELARVGAHELSIRALTAAAGLTAGAFYSNFRSRDEYLSELCSSVIEDFLASIRKTLDRACRGTIEQAIEANALWARNVDERIACAMLEFGMLAHSDEKFRKNYMPMASAFQEQLAALLRAFFETFRLRPQMSYEQMASGFMTMWMGQLMFRYMPDHERFRSAIALFLSELIRASSPVEKQP